MTNSLTRIACCALALVTAFCASGCVSVHSYVESGHDTVDFRELQPRDPPTPVRLSVSFSVNGEPRPGLPTTVLYNEVARTLIRSSVLTPVDDPAAATLQVNVDDQFDKSEGDHNGWISGLTLGSSGSVVRDEYHFSYSLISAEPGAKPQTGLYHHAMITLLGNAPPPGYGQPQDMDQAFSVIVKQSALAFLHDLEGIDGGDPVMMVPDAH